MENITLLGIDFGSKRVGLAISHGIIAEAIKSLPYDAVFDEEISKLVKDQHINKIIVGLPLDKDGETAQSKLIKEQAGKLAELLGIEIIFVDEAYSSLEADRLHGRDKNFDRDSESAKIILDQYLNETRN